MCVDYPSAHAAIRAAARFELSARAPELDGADGHGAVDDAAYAASSAGRPSVGRLQQWDGLLARWRLRQRQVSLRRDV